MRLYGHIAYADALPGAALCGKPNRIKRKPALLYCGKCVRVAVENSKHAPVTITWTFGNGGAA